MSLNIGIMGLGFMGKMHFETYAKIKGAKVAAIADVDERKRSGDWSSIGGNIGSADKCQDLRGINVYANPEDWPFLGCCRPDENLAVVPSLLFDQYNIGR